MNYRAPMIKSLTFLGLAVLFVMMGQATPALAQESLRDLRAQQQQERALRQQAAYTSSVCETRLSASINWQRSKNWSGKRSLADACDDALSAVESLCRSGLKQNIQSRIKSFQCSGDGSGPSLSGSTLRYGAGNGNGYQQTRQYLDRVLR